jgi:hypothetical protein
MASKQSFAAERRRRARPVFYRVKSCFARLSLTLWHHAAMLAVLGIGVATTAATA